MQGAGRDVLPLALHSGSQRGPDILMGIISFHSVPNCPPSLAPRRIQGGM